MNDTGAPLLRLMWLASPALPVGGFSYSEGLEAATEAGLVTSEAQAADWLLDQLRLGKVPFNQHTVDTLFKSLETLSRLVHRAILP